MPLPRLEGKTGHGGSSWQGGGFQGTFQPGCVLLLAEREHRSPAIGGTGCKSTLPGTSSSVTHARIPAPALAEETTPVNHLHGEEVVAVGGNIKARSKRRRAKRSSPPLHVPRQLFKPGLPRALGSILLHRWGWRAPGPADG